jgi:hypothetical protein
MHLDDPASYPVSLRVQVRRAACLAHDLAVFVERTSPGDASFLWALGRADEVRAFVGALVREWNEGRVEAQSAAERIHVYVRGLEESLLSFQRASERIARARSSRPPCDTLIDS